MPAAGRGTRLGADLPKQYLMLAGRSMLEWSVQTFLIDAACRGLVVALAPDDEHWSQVRSRLQRVPIEAVGGAERADSVRAALQRLQASGVAAEEWVLVHDAARPCVSAAEIHALLSAVGSVAEPLTGRVGALAGGLLALPVTDTLKRDRSGAGLATSRETVAREGLWRALTPQMFRLGALLSALDAALAAGRRPTDEAQAMEWQGAQPLLVAGESTNLKVTTAQDWALAEGILAARGAQP
jgi:2-C-methyl-D-erythritol 4-phosphate cytidylyltransferase